MLNATNNKVQFGAKFLVLLKDKWGTEFAQACDIFEKGKVIATLQPMTITFSEKITFEKCQRVIEHMRKVPDHCPVFIHVISIQNGNSIELNDGHVDPFIDKSVRMVSDGEKWCMMADILKAYSIPHTTDEYLFIQ